MFQDLAYAKLSPHYDVIRSIYDKFTGLIHFPTTIIKLDCAPEIQLERIRRRGRKQERSIERLQLVELSKNIDECLAELLDECKNKLKDERKIEVVEINSGEKDFVTNPEAQRIAARIGEFLAGSCPVKSAEQ